MDSPSSGATGDLYIVDFDYPISIFIAFAVLCAVESARVLPKGRHSD
jgi:hypothetical protein